MTTRSKPRLVPLLWAVLALAPTGAAADEPSLEMGVFVGQDDLDGRFELGNAYHDDQVPGDGVLFGARIHYRVLGGLSLELEGKFAPAATHGNPEQGRYPVASPVLGVRVHAIYDLFRLWRLQPFVALGAGADTVWFAAPDSYLVESDTDANAYWGLGARFALGDRFGVRADARQIIGYGRADDTAVGYEATAGVYFTFGGGGSNVAAAPAPTIAKALRPAVRRPRAKPGRTKPAVAALRAAVEEPGPELALARLTQPAVHSALELPGKDEVSLMPESPDSEVEPEPEPEPDDAGTIDTLEAAQAVLASVLYDHGRSRLKRRARRALDKVVEYMNERPLATVLIVGHADSEGDDRTNIVLSRKRADTAKWYLVDRGITRDRIDTLGLGEAEPADTNQTDSGRARNRRIEIEVID